MFVQSKMPSRAASVDQHQEMRSPNVAIGETKMIGIILSQHSETECIRARAADVDEKRGIPLTLRSRESMRYDRL
jgi:hypothetical protein